MLGSGIRNLAATDGRAAIRPQGSLWACTDLELAWLRAVFLPVWETPKQGTAVETGPTRPPRSG